MKWIILSFFSLIFWIGLYLYLHLGFSKPVDIEVTEFPAVTLIYKEHIGAYHKIGPVIESVESILREQGISCSMTFGEYLDDPGEIEEDRLKSYGGCLFFEGSDFIERFKLNESLMTREIEGRKVVQARFKGSPSIGPIKVYPKIDEIIQDQRLVRTAPIMEIYEIQGDSVTTTYVQPVQ